MQNRTVLVPGAWLLPTLLLAWASGARPASGQTAAPPTSDAGVMLSRDCALCHSNSATASAMRDAAGRPIAPFDLWNSTMMANSARDPLWRAVMSAEVAAMPARRAEIEATCLRCHAPMAARLGLEEHGTGAPSHVLDCDGEIGSYARDGVSCTICHGISPEGLGSEASFSAGFELDSQRRLFGPHAAPFAMPMRAFTTFTPVQGQHVVESALCGSCHTLETRTFDQEGEPTDERFLEQAPYLEWRNSAYRDEGEARGERAASCQACHVPRHDTDGLEIRSRIARNPGGRDFPPIVERAPFGRHLFVGANTLVLSMLREHADELRVEASDAALRATLAATHEQLAEHSARVAIEDVRRTDGRLSFRVHVDNLAGHKLPTGHPTRRAWLRVVVTDASGQVLFASGITNDAGQIVGPGGEPLPEELAGGPLRPHLDVVRRASEVATYEGILADVRGAGTHTLLRAASWLVDDRLLPLGWDPGHPEAWRTAPVGVAGDGDFVGGSDHVTYELGPLPPGELAITAQLVYQTLGARWAAELLRWDTPEVATFRRMYQAADRRPVVLASEQRTCPED